MCHMPPVEWLAQRFYICGEGVLRYARNAGKAKKDAPAGTAYRDGYKKVQVAHDGRLKKLAVHRIVASLTLGFPVPDDKQVDHDNRDRHNNTPLNVKKLVTQRENNLNRCVVAKGYTKRRGRYIAQISINGRNFSLGSFTNSDEAHAAYWRARRGEHPKVKGVLDVQHVSL